MKKLSVVIPSYKDRYMPKTVQSILDNSELGDELEVVVVLDGYEPEFELVIDPRVRYIRQENTGMRGAINRGVKESTGEYIARFDEHIMVCPAWDKILLEDITDCDIWTGKRFFLNPEEWVVMDKPPVLAEKLIIDKDRHKFAGVRCAKPDGDIFEVTAMQGSFWIMSRKHWDGVIVELQEEGLGKLYQDSVEMCFRTWASGGKLMRNNRMWYAHKERGFKRTHNIDGSESQKSFDYARELWKDDFEKYKKEWKTRLPHCY